MSRKFIEKVDKQFLASKVADEIVKDEEYDPIGDPDCYGKPRETFSGNDIAFLKSANHAVYSCLGSLTPRIEKDLEKVEFDTENLEWFDDVYCGAESICGFQTLPNGLTYMGVTAGGDWEMPIFFIIYHDGKELRAYIPKDGNTWNHKRKAAFGNEEEEEIADSEFDAQFGTSDGMKSDVNVDCDAICQDIQKRIQYAGG